MVARATSIGAAARTPSASRTRATSSSDRNLLAVNGPDAPSATTHESAAYDATMRSVSSSRPLLSPDISTVIENTTDVAITAMRKRRRRYCRSRTPTSHMSRMCSRTA
jgi:hypothetical protein